MYGQSSRSAYSQRGGNQNSNQGSRRPEINQLSHEVGEQVVNNEEYAEFLRYKQAVNYGVFAVSSSASNQERSRFRRNDGPRAKILIQNEICSFLVDTGSPINVVDERTFNSWSAKPKLDACNTRYFGYNSKSPLPIRGQFTTEIQFKNRKIQAGFIVIEGEAECLISFKTACGLSIICFDDEDKRPKEFGVNGSKWFSKLDIIKAFHQLMLHEDSRNIPTHMGLF